MIYKYAQDSMNEQCQVSILSLQSTLVRMKFILFASISVAILSATASKMNFLLDEEQSMPSLNIQELVLSIPFDFGYKLSEWIDRVECIADLDAIWIEGTHFEWDRSEYENLRSEWNECININNVSEQLM